MKTLLLKASSGLKALKEKAGGRYKWAVITAAALVLASAGIWFFILRESPPPPWETVAASKTDIQEAVSVTGTVKPVQDVVLTFKNGGYVEACGVKVGDPVRAGDLMAQESQEDLATQLAASSASYNSARAIYDQTQAGQEPEKNQVQAELKEQEASLLAAEQSLQRSEKLFEAGGASQSELDLARKEYDAASARFQAAYARFEQVCATQPGKLESAAAQAEFAGTQVELAGYNLDASKIVAPFDGYVALIQGNVGQWTSGGAPPVGTAPSSQFSIRVASRELLLAVQINEADIGKVVAGQEVEFRVDAYPDETFHGLVSSVAPMPVEDGKVKSYEAIITGFETGKLKGGLAASASIKTASAKDVITVPQTALSYARSYLLKNPEANPDQAETKDSVKKKTARKHYLVVLENNTPIVKEVKTGLSDEQSIAIVSGLSEGEMVVVDGGLPSTVENDSSGSI